MMTKIPAVLVVGTKSWNLPPPPPFSYSYHHGPTTIGVEMDGVDINKIE
jgi:hypothetical protein